MKLLNGKLRVFSLICSTIIVFTSCPEGLPNGAETTSKVIGPPGGTLISADEKLTIEVPEGALTGNTAISITSLAATGEFSFGYELEPQGLTFAIPAVIKLVLPDAAVQEDGSLNGYELYGQYREGAVYRGIERLARRLSTGGTFNAGRY